MTSVTTIDPLREQAMDEGTVVDATCQHLSSRCKRQMSTTQAQLRGLHPLIYTHWSQTS